jgi:hypothetical protein
MNKSTNQFKIYTPIEAILMFILALIGGIGALLFISKYFINVFDWHPAFGKALLLMIALGLFGLLQQFTSIELTAEMTDLGINFSGYRTWLFKPDKFIGWMDIHEWKLNEGITGGDTWSPSVFTIKYGYKKKLDFYITDNDLNLSDFFNFLGNFKEKIAELNLKNDGIKTIIESKKFEETKAYAILMTTIAIAFLILLIYIFPTDYTSFDIPLWQLIASIVVLIGVQVLLSVLAFKAIKKSYFNE